MASEHPSHDPNDSSESRMLRQSPIDSAGAGGSAEHPIEDPINDAASDTHVPHDIEDEEETSIAMPIDLTDIHEPAVIELTPNETEGVQRTLREFRRNYQRRAGAAFGSSVPM